MKLFSTKNTKGFTIIETLVAIFIITVAIGATLSAAQMGLQSSFYARDQISAFYLAEEAIEQVRSIRDTNYIATTTCPWLTGGDESDGCLNIPVECIQPVGDNTPRNCSVDVVTDISAVGITPCSGSSCTLKLDSANGYNHVTGTNSNYSRHINIKLVSDTEAEVVATVTWSSGPFGGKTFTVREVLFDWEVR